MPSAAMRSKCGVRFASDPNGPISPYPRSSMKTTMKFGGRSTAVPQPASEAIRSAHTAAKMATLDMGSDGTECPDSVRSGCASRSMLLWMVHGRRPNLPKPGGRRYLIHG